MLDYVIDWETYFDKDYSLKKIPMQQYVLDPRFEVMGCAINDKWYDPEELPAYLATIDWPNVNMIGHNLLFDGLILSHYYGYKPKLYSCTLSYTRAVMGSLLPRYNLETVVATLAGGHKDTAALTNMMGVRRADVDKSSDAWQRYTTYAVGDATSAKKIYDILLPHMPDMERIIVDIIIRMFIEGRLVLEPTLVEQAIEEAVALTSQKLAAAGVTDRKELRSREKFADTLRNLGVTVPLKISRTTGKETYAFAKNDLAFMELLEHHDDRVSTLVDAKLNASSTINETRAARLKTIAAMTPEHKLMVPLAYSGAHTHRFSGLDKLNLQNLPRGSLLRRAIKAPKGYKLVVRDASQIEARILAFVAGQWDLVKQFAKGEDVYSSFATTVYGFPVNKHEHPVERFIGKTGILGLGYGSAAATFYHMVMASASGATIDLKFAEQVVWKYRSAYPLIVALWRQADKLLPAMKDGAKQMLGPAETDDCRMLLPSGLFINYPQLAQYEDYTYEFKRYVWKYYKPKYKTFTNIYGAKVIENLIQALARIQITDTMVKMRMTNPEWHCALQVHDELVYLTPEDEAEECDRYLSHYMNEQPRWARSYPYELPLANEGGIGEVYGQIK